ncbi:MAG: aminotransferase class III-fold pyridoxal phosphate-dependent enzyme, partial [Planctomycetota bacterium]
MHRWRQQPPLVIERAEGFDLIDTHGNRYLDGVSSLWCNVHGHRHPHLDQAIRDQLDKAAHTTLLGLASPPSIELAARLVGLVNDRLGIDEASPRRLERVFYTDAGATAVEVAIKMAVGYWRH